LIPNSLFKLLTSKLKKVLFIVNVERYLLPFANPHGIAVIQLHRV
jgi:hypothetical protein